MEITYDGILDAIDKLFGVIKEIVNQIMSIIKLVGGSVSGDAQEEEVTE